MPGALDEVVELTDGDDMKNSRRVMAVGVLCAALAGAWTAPAAAANGDASKPASPATSPLKPISPADLISPADPVSEAEEEAPVDAAPVSAESLPGASSDAVAAAVQSIADALLEEYGEEYGAVEWISSEGRARIWWHGEVPSTVEQLSNVASAVVPVEIASMAYSVPQLNNAAREILQSSAASDTGISSVTSKTDGSGLSVSFEEQADADELVGAQARSADPDTGLTSASLGASESIPIEVEVGGEVTPTADGRLTPTLPYAAGTRMYATYVGAGCSTSFSIKLTAPRADRNRPYGMLTAQHCGNWGPGTWATANNYFLGYKASEYSSTSRDASVLVNDATQSGVPNTGRIYEHKMYRSNYSALGGRNVVVGSSAPVIGGSWCHSGSYSGTICGNTINSTNVFANYGGPATNVGPLIRTVHTSGTPSVGSGDSGGPSFATTTTTGQVRATGIISGVQNGTSSCSGVQDRLYCSPTALIVPLSGALSAVGGGAVLQTLTNG